MDAARWGRCYLGEAGLAFHPNLEIRHPTQGYKRMPRKMLRVAWGLAVQAEPVGVGIHPEYGQPATSSRATLPCSSKFRVMVGEHSLQSQRYGIP